MKCLPAFKIQETKGYVLHDWHAEVLAIRSFNHFLLQECLRLSESADYISDILEWRAPNDDETLGIQRFTIRENTKLHIYASEAPCGDASMELVMSAQEDATPWPVSAFSGSNHSRTMLGHECFSELGIVRRKPGMASEDVASDYG